jgi:hypothetical protein
VGPYQTQIRSVTISAILLGHVVLESQNHHHHRRRRRRRHHHHLLSQFSFPLVLVIFNQWRTPPLKLHVSHCGTFLIMCDVPSTAPFCTESIEWFPGIVYGYF